MLYFKMMDAISPSVQDIPVGLITCQSWNGQHLLSYNFLLWSINDNTQVWGNQCITQYTGHLTSALTLNSFTGLLPKTFDKQSI